MNIRPLRADDIPAAVELDADSFRDLFERLTGKPTDLPPRETAYFEHWMRADPDGALVAEDAGELVGLIFCHARGRAGWIGPLAVRPGRQARGLGKALLRAGLQYFERRGCRWVGLDTYPQNPVSVSLYLKAGFRIRYAMLQLEFNGRSGPEDFTYELAPAGLADLDALAAADERVSGFNRRPDFEFLMRWDRAAAFHVTLRGQAVGQVCAYQKRGKGVVGGLLLPADHADAAADVAALAAGFLRGLGLERVVVLCPGYEERLFARLLARGARTLMTTVRLYRGERAAMPREDERSAAYAPLASEKG